MFRFDLQKGTVIIHHNFGFFSCCSVRLYAIVTYFNETKRLPHAVDSSDVFSWYKAENESRDVTYEYFEPDNPAFDLESVGGGQGVLPSNIDYHHGHQFRDYHGLDYKCITPFINMYFSPSAEVQQRMRKMEEKYKLEDYGNITVLFHRGNDKKTETKLCTHQEIAAKGKAVLKKHPGMRFLIQSDETEFIEGMKTEFPDHIVFSDEIRHVKHCEDTVDRIFRSSTAEFSKYYLAITIIMSRCKYVVCGSGNCDIWILLYRGHANNVYQYLNGHWLE